MKILFKYLLKQKNKCWYINRIPANIQKKIDWIEAIRAHQIFNDKSEHASVCHLHFHPENFTPKGKLMDDAIPTVFDLYEVEEIDIGNRLALRIRILFDFDR